MKVQYLPLPEATRFSDWVREKQFTLVIKRLPILSAYASLTLYNQALYEASLIDEEGKPQSFWGPYSDQTFGARPGRGVNPQNAVYDLIREINACGGLCAHVYDTASGIVPTNLYWDEKDNDLITIPGVTNA